VPETDIELPSWIGGASSHESIDPTGHDVGGALLAIRRVGSLWDVVRALERILEET
jgi:hypothetical protein